MKFLVIAMSFVASAALANNPQAVRVVSEAAKILPEKSVRLLAGKVEQIFSDGYYSILMEGDLMLTPISKDKFKHINSGLSNEQILAGIAGEKFEFNNSDFVEVALPEQTTVLVPQGLFDWINNKLGKGTVGAEALHEQAMEAISQLLNKDYEAFNLGGVVFTMTEDQLLVDQAKSQLRATK